MNEDIRTLIQTIHNNPGRVMIVAAGAGTQALAWLLGVAGASRTLVEALITYDEASFKAFLGREPGKYVSSLTAGCLSGRAVARARALYLGAEPVIGLACTATIVTDRPKRGEHRAHIATWTAGQVIRHGLTLNKGKRDRKGEEVLVSRLILNALAEAYGLELRVPLPLFTGDHYHHEVSDLSALATRLHEGQLDFFGVGLNGQVIEDQNPQVLLSGAFNPLHEGHLSLARMAAEILGQEVTFELAVINADKPALSLAETLQRLLQFAGGHPVLVSNAPTFVAKAQLFPNTTFIIGVDTADRVLDSRFYGDSHERMLLALAKIREQGCRFLVAGRKNAKGVFRDAADLDMPKKFEDLFVLIQAKQYRHDISSTELRAREKTGNGSGVAVDSRPDFK
jgi:nicotinic acid mononucleotide adenylyltransferase